MSVPKSKRKESQFEVIKHYEQFVGEPFVAH